MQRLDHMEKELRELRTQKSRSSFNGPTFLFAFIAAVFASFAVPWATVRTQATAMAREARVAMERQRPHSDKKTFPAYSSPAFPSAKEPDLPAAADAPLSDALILLPAL